MDYDEFRKLYRDLMGLRGLLYGMSDSIQNGTDIDEAEPMLLAEIAERCAETVKDQLERLEKGGEQNS